MQDIHGYDKQVQNYLTSIQTNPDITEQNKDDAADFTRWMKTRQEMSDARVSRYLASLKKVMAHDPNDFRLKTASEQQIETLVQQINDSAYYHSDYAAETKKEYKKFLRSYYRWANDGTLPEKAAWITASVPESKKERTHPQDLQRPRDIKQIAQHMGSLRDQAILLTHWDLGSRIGETLNIRVKDFFEEDDAYYIRVPGNKQSPDRTARVDVAAPILRRWLEEDHPAPDDPEAFLFCKVNGDADGHTTAPYPYFKKKIRDAVDDLGLDCKPGTHIIRKSRVSFLKNAGMPESDVDQRVGHVPGSRVTRDYTRIDDTDANNAYAGMYGNSEKELDNDLLPLPCPECGLENAGFRDRCYHCNTILTSPEIQQAMTEDKADEIREALWKVVKEEGLMDEIKEAVE